MTRMSQEAIPDQMVYVVIGYAGEWSSLRVWVAGVYTDKATAIMTAEQQKATDRSDYVRWMNWISEFGRRMCAANERVELHEARKAQIERLGMAPEPPIGGDDTEYTVACVPLNTPGVWDYA